MEYVCWVHSIVSNSDLYIEVKGIFPILFTTKNRYFAIFLSCVVYKFKCVISNFSYNGETGRNLKVRSRKHIGILSLTLKRQLLGLRQFLAAASPLKLMKNAF